MKRTTRLLALAALALLAILAIWGYFSGPRRVANAWLACHGSEDSSLTTADDQAYWADAHPDSLRRPLQAYYDACLDTSRVTAVAIHGRRALVRFSTTHPTLTWEQLTEFPATATTAERTALVRERAAKVKYVTTEDTLELRLDAVHWRVALNLREAVLYARALKRAEESTGEGRYAIALSIYDSLASQSESDSVRLKSLFDERLNVLGIKACRAAVGNHLKYPESTEFDLSGLASLRDNGPTSVIGNATAPNSFGVKRQLTINCDVTFSADKPTAYVDLLMFYPSDASSLITEDSIKVDL